MSETNNVKTTISRGAFLELHLSQVAAGKTWNEFLRHCVVNYVDFEKGKKTSEEYWESRCDYNSEASRLLVRAAKKSYKASGSVADAEYLEDAESTLVPFTFRKPEKISIGKTGTGTGRGRKPDPVKIAAAEMAQSALANAIAKRNAAKLEKMRQDAESLASETKRNEWDTSTSSENATAEFEAMIPG